MADLTEEDQYARLAKAAALAEDIDKPLGDPSTQHDMLVQFIGHKQKPTRCFLIDGDLWVLTQPRTMKKVRLTVLDKLHMLQVVDLGDLMFGLVMEDEPGPHEFVVEDPAVKLVWMFALLQNILAHQLLQGYGALHKVVLGTVWSWAVYGITPSTRTLDELKAFDLDEATAMHLAAYYGQPEVVAHLLETQQGMSQLFHADAHGDYPLHLAARNGCFSVLDTVLTHPDLSDRYTELLLQLGGGGETVVWNIAFGKRGPDTGSRDVQLVALALKMHCFELSSLVNHKYSLDIMHECARLDDAELLAALDKFALPMDTVCSGRRLIHTAAVYFSSAVLEFLLQSGRSPNLPDSAGALPLFLLPVEALQMNSNPAELLLSHGARLCAGSPGSETFEEMFPWAQEEDIKWLTAARHEYLAAQAPEGQFENPRYFFVEDKASSTCMACQASFTMRFRKHHCRFCGILVCGPCSSKQYLRDLHSTLLRCCDGCFNYLRYASEEERRRITQFEGIVDRKKQETLWDSMPRPEEKDEPLVKSKAAIMETKEKLALRGDKLKKMDDKSAQLAAQASNFHELAKQLRQQL